MLHSGIGYRKSVVCNVHVPYSGVETFSSISASFFTLAILWPLCKILWRLSQGNPSVGGVKCKRGPATYVTFGYLCGSWASELLIEYLL